MPEPEEFRIGCSGWSYKDWVGPFYPSNTEAKDYLKLYSRTFDCVEIDSSFYRIPSPGMVSQWKSSTPDGFTFCPKLTKKITHENKLENFESTLLYFYSVMSKLGNKLGPIVVQLPPSVKVEKHKAAMERFVSSLEPKFKHAIEFRHKSWFTPETYKLLEKNNVAMAWSINQYLETPPEVTADFVYLRMVGTREITQFTGIQKEMRDGDGALGQGTQGEEGVHQGQLRLLQQPLRGLRAGVCERVQEAPRDDRGRLEQGPRVDASDAVSDS